MVVPVNMLVLTAAYMMVNMLMNIILNSQNLIYNKGLHDGLKLPSSLPVVVLFIHFIKFISLNVIATL